MANIQRLLNNYITKIAEFSHYQQILKLQKDIKDLQAAVNTAAKNNSNDKVLTSMVSNLGTKINTVVNLATNFGLSSATSAKYRNDIASQVEQLHDYLMSVDKNQFYDMDGVYYLLGKLLNDGAINEDLETYIPSSISAVNPKRTQAPKKEPEQTHKVPAFDMHPRPGMSGYVPGSEKPEWDVDKIQAIRGNEPFPTKDNPQQIATRTSVKHNITKLAKNEVNLHGFEILNDVKSFPVGDMRYVVISRDYSQNPSTENHGAFDTFEAAIKHGSNLIPDKADVVRIIDDKRDMVIAIKKANSNITAIQKLAQEIEDTYSFSPVSKYLALASQITPEMATESPAEFMHITNHMQKLWEKMSTKQRNEVIYQTSKSPKSDALDII